jgi:RimJ/RimL family protein N-acetyltransferase
MITCGVAWNLYYRLTPEAQGRGYATELAMSSCAAAARLRPDLPVVALLLEHNQASGAVARRCGLKLVWRGPDVGNPDRAAVRLIYADRDLIPGTIQRLLDHVRASD